MACVIAQEPAHESPAGQLLEPLLLERLDLFGVELQRKGNVADALPAGFARLPENESDRLVGRLTRH